MQVVVVDFKAVYYHSTFIENQKKLLHHDVLWVIMSHKKCCLRIHCPTVPLSRGSVSTWSWRTKRNFHLLQREMTNIEVITALPMSSK
jgi:hypothetical protein